MPVCEGKNSISTGSEQNEGRSSCNNCNFEGNTDGFEHQSKAEIWRSLSLSLSFSSLLSHYPTSQSDLSICANSSADSALSLEILLHMTEVTLSQESKSLLQQPEDGDISSL